MGRRTRPGSMWGGRSRTGLVAPFLCYSKAFSMLTRQEALDLFRSDDLIGIGMAADALRRKLHPEGIVSYIIDRNINYTNFCTEYCSFCAFYRPLGHAEGYILPKETIYQ